MVSGQNHYNIRLNPVESGGVSTSCYDIQLASADAVSLNLAGQNYRLYYDATKLGLKEEMSTSLLPSELYTKLVLKDNFKNINATGAGNLDFDSNLSFFNLGNDIKDELVGGIVLPASGEWVSTARVCFEVLGQTGSSSTTDKNNIFWARPELTSNYATAYVEVAEWVSPSITRSVKAAIYFDEEVSTANINQQWEYQPAIYPNPARDLLFVEYAGQEELLVQLYTIHGKLLINNHLSAGALKKQLDISSYPAGMYQLRLSNRDKILVKKIEIIN